MPQRIGTFGAIFDRCCWLRMCDNHSLMVTDELGNIWEAWTDH
jgi:hypothetical protein